MLTLGIVLIAHCIFDFYLQSTGMAVQKRPIIKYWFCTA